MKTVIVGLLATVLLGAAIIAPDATSEVPADSSSISPESVSVSDNSLPESPDVPDSEVTDESVPESESAPDPGEDSAENETEPENDSTEEEALDESELEAVKNRSPAPLSPKKVSSFAPNSRPNLCISTSPREIKLALALFPSFNPSHKPLAIAITFL